MSGFQMQRLGLAMEPEPGNPYEAEGVLNPAGARGPDGHFYLFPRLVAKGNYSRIGIARVNFNDNGDPAGVERLGIALEPEVDYERRPHGGGGCEDPRISFCKDINRYVMTYTAFSSAGPRIALAVSDDLFHWQRLGLATFRPFAGIEFNGVDDKDASIFPVAIPEPSGIPAVAIIHRPLFPGTRPEEKVCDEDYCLLDLHRESIWISYCPLNEPGDEPYHLCHFSSHRRLASPVAPWERLKIGGGTPPILTRHGWMVIYHGVSEVDDTQKLRYSAGILILSREDPHVIRYRSPEPILTPESPEELKGVVANVVFPTAIDCRTDIGLPDRFDVYYGMADDRIGVAKLNVPEVLQQGTPADPPMSNDTHRVDGRVQPMKKPEPTIATAASPK